MLAMESVRRRWSSFVELLKKEKEATKYHLALVILSVGMFCFGVVSSTMLTRYYYLEGGSLRWFQTALISAGFPICIPLMAYLCRIMKEKPRILTPKLAFIYIVIGAISAADNLMYAWGLSYLPASTSGLLVSTQLAFTCVFSLLIVRQKITIYSWNCIVLVTFSAIILALRSSSDRLAGVSNHQYQVGFACTIGAAALYGLYLPLTQLVYLKVYKKFSIILVLEFQIYVSLVGTIIPLIGMAFGEFSKIGPESRTFAKGKTVYCIVLVMTAICYQMVFLGLTGMTFLCSSVLAGMVVSAIIPFTSLFALIFFHDNFGALKIVAMLISIWGFLSYTYGSYMESKTRASAADNVDLLEAT